MNCRKARNIILTDYIDGALSKKDDDALESHLSACEKCRVLAAEARRTLRDPFPEAYNPVPPEAIWRNIERQIIAEPRAAFRRQGIPVWDRLAGLRLPSVYRWALASALAFLVALTVFHRPAPRQTADVEEMDKEISYIAYMLDEAAPEESTEGYGTVIEEYFL